MKNFRRMSITNWKRKAEISMSALVSFQLVDGFEL